MQTRRKISSPADLRVGDHVSFEYHDKRRHGVVEQVDYPRYITIKHAFPEDYDNKMYSCYRFSKITSGIRVYTQDGHNWE